MPPIPLAHSTCQHACLAPNIPKMKRRYLRFSVLPAFLLVVFFTAVSCGTISDNISGRYERFYPGPLLQRDQVAFLAPDVGGSDGMNYIITLDSINGVPKKLINVIELTPSVYRLQLTCRLVGSPAYIGGNGISFEAKPGRVYAIEAEFSRQISASGVFPVQSWLPQIKDITDEQSARKQQVETFIQKRRQ
jgi:hypothetical protein